jgi:hypothetical protein
MDISTVVEVETFRGLVLRDLVLVPSFAKNRFSCVALGKGGDGGTTEIVLPSRLEPSGVFAREEGSVDTTCAVRARTIVAAAKANGEEGGMLTLSGWSDGEEGVIRGV